MNLTVIRPLVYMKEADVIGFVHKHDVPVVKSPCPADGHTRREYVKQLLRQLNLENPGVKDRMFTAVQSGLGNGGYMKNSNNYHDETAKENILQLRKLQEELPRFCRQYFRGIEQTTAPARGLPMRMTSVSFEFLHKNNSVLSKTDITEFPLSVLDQITKADIEEYLEYLSYYVKDDGTEYTNDERGKRRKARFPALVL